MEVGKDHQVYDIQPLYTKFGKRYIAEIDGEYRVFLPPRFAKAFDENPEEFEKLLDTAHKRQLYMETTADRLTKITFKTH